MCGLTSEFEMGRLKEYQHCVPEEDENAGLGMLEERGASRGRESVGSLGFRSESADDGGVIYRSDGKSKWSAHETAVTSRTRKRSRKGEVGHGCLVLDEARRGEFICNETYTT